MICIVQNIRIFSRTITYILDYSLNKLKLKLNKSLNNWKRNNDIFSTSINGLDFMGVSCHKDTETNTETNL